MLEKCCKMKKKMDKPIYQRQMPRPQRVSTYSLWIFLLFLSFCVHLFKQDFFVKLEQFFVLPLWIPLEPVFQVFVVVMFKDLSAGTRTGKESGIGRYKIILLSLEIEIGTEVMAELLGVDRSSIRLQVNMRFALIYRRISI